MVRSFGFAVVVSIVVVAFCGVVSLQDKTKEDKKYELRLKFKEGQKWADTIKISGSMKMTKPIQEQSNASMEVDFTSEVKSIDKEGKATIELSTKKLKAIREEGGHKKVEFDSDKKNNNNDSDPDIRDFKKMLDEKIEIKIDPLGKAETTLVGIKATFNLIYDIVVLPKESVKVGDKWTTEVEEKRWNPSGSGKIKIISTLEKIEEFNKKKCAVIKCDVGLSPSPEKEEEKELSGKATIYFSLEDGAPLKFTGKMEVKEMGTDITMEFELNRKAEEEKKEEKK